MEDPKIKCDNGHCQNRHTCQRTYVEPDNHYPKYMTFYPRESQVNTCKNYIMMRVRNSTSE